MARDLLTDAFWMVAKVAWPVAVVLVALGVPAMMGEMWLLRRVGEWAQLVMLRAK